MRQGEPVGGERGPPGSRVVPAHEDDRAHDGESAQEDEQGGRHVAAPSRRPTVCSASMMRSRALAAMASLFSMPRKRRPSKTAATPVVPEPMNGSSTVAPRGRNADELAQQEQGFLGDVDAVLSVRRGNAVQARQARCRGLRAQVAVRPPDQILGRVRESPPVRPRAGLVPDHQAAPHPASGLQGVGRGGQLSPVSKDEANPARLGEPQGLG